MPDHELDARDVRRKLTPTTVTLATEQREAVDALARQKNRTRSYVVRQALDLMLAVERGPTGSA